MRRPGFWAVIGLALAVAGIVTAWLSFQAVRGLQLRDPDYKLLQAILPVGLGIIVGGLILTAIAFVVQRKRSQLERGDRLVAHWRIGPLDWDAFRRRDAARDGLFPSLRNRLRLPAALPPEGMEIRIGEDAMLVGDGCYGLGYFASRGKLVDVALFEGRPAMLEFTTHQTGRNYSKLVVFRLPVTDMVRTGAQAVLDHFNRTIDPRRRDSAHSHFAPHFRAATGDAGEAEAARADNRSRNWRATGFSLLLVGSLILAIRFLREPGPNADLTGILILTIGGGAAVLAGLLALAWSILGRR
jgi:hypothetical protein